METLFSKLPYLYEQSKEVKAIQDSIEGERTVLTDKLDDMYNQLFINSADWSLYKWETLLGIKVTDNKLEARRENILAKLRSNGITNIQAIKDICSTFSAGQVKIIEDFSNYSFIVKFISEESIPSNLDGLTRAINDVIPCHLSWDYLFAYNIWLQAKELNWELSFATWGDDKTSDFIDTGKVAICSNTSVCSEILLAGSGV